jgi:aldehyde dehydrogenase (NAD+)
MNVHTLPANNTPNTVLPASGPLPAIIDHWLAEEAPPSSTSQGFLDVVDPKTGETQARLVCGNPAVVQTAVAMAQTAFDVWAQTNVVERALILRRATQRIEAGAQVLASIIHAETGKSLRDALGEVSAVVEMGYFVAGEGRRFYGKTTTSAIAGRSASTQRQPVGVWALIIASNTPAANVAWKVFPALLCGNSMILKPSEDTPYTALWMAQQLTEAGLPTGVLQIVQGRGPEVGPSLVRHPLIAGISFTGSVAVGREIAQAAGARLAKVCLELGGKNALVVCDDADLETAVEAALLSAFSNAGQRCAAASRLLVMPGIYAAFRERLLARTQALRLGSADADDLGPVINVAALRRLEQAMASLPPDARVLCGGARVPGLPGYYWQPTIIENTSMSAAISQEELFGPLTCLYRVDSLEDAISQVHQVPFALTAAVHTQDIGRALRFQAQCRVGVVSINGPTYGSEPHLPFGGLGASGNGWREAGTEALDVYSDWKTVYTRGTPQNV